MAKKPQFVEDIDYAAMMTPANQQVRKFGHDITNGKKALSDFMEIPVQDCVPFTKKMNSDFSKYRPERFEELKASIIQHGVIEPITVRFLDGQIGTYEIIAGEHRWSASKAVGKRTVPAHILKDCDDDKARMIFAATNLIRRDNMMSDLINGWWTYFSAVKNKRASEIEAMKNAGDIPSEFYDMANDNKRTAYRLARMHDLIPEFIELADQKHLGIRAGEQIAYIPREKQADLIPFKQHINNMEKASQLRSLAEGKIKGATWSPETIKNILFPVVQTNQQFKEVLTQATDIIRRRLPPSLYSQAPSIIEEALNLYQKKYPDKFSADPQKS